MKRYIALLASLVSLVGFPVPASAIAPPTASVIIYAYDAVHSPAIVASDAFERGPPVRTSTASTYDAVDRWSNGAWARSGRAATPTAYTYNDLTAAVQVVKTAATTSEVTPGIQRTAALATRSQVAAKGVPALRQAYVDEVAGLSGRAASMRAVGVSSEDIARALHAERRTLGVKYKNRTPADELARIYARNQEKYGDLLGQSIDYLISRGMSWDDIIESAMRTGGKDLGY